MLNKVRAMLKLLGFSPSKILSYTNNSNKVAYRILLRQSDIKKFKNIINFRVDYKRQKLKSFFMR